MDNFGLVVTVLKSLVMLLG